MPVPCRTRLANGVLGVVTALVALSSAGYWAWDASVRFRVDTAVPAVMLGRPGCVTAAAFSGPDGRRQVVNLRRYKSNCIDAQPGARVTVYYDRSDPSVHARSRSWWWPALLTLPMLPVGYVGIGTVQRAVRPAACPGRFGGPGSTGS